MCDVALSVRPSVGEWTGVLGWGGCTPHLSVPQFPPCAQLHLLPLWDSRCAGGCKGLRGAARARRVGGWVRRASGREGSVRRCRAPQQPPDEFPSQALIDSGGFEILLPIKLTTRWGFPPRASATLAVPWPPTPTSPAPAPLTARGAPKIKSRGRPLLLLPSPARGVPRPDAPPGPAGPGSPVYYYDFFFSPPSTPPPPAPAIVWGFMVPEQKEGKGFIGSRAIKLSGSPRPPPTPPPVNPEPPLPAPPHFPAEG